MKKNLPNLLSLSRLVATALVFALVLIDQSWSFLAATVLFVIASVTDFFDGYLARRYHVESPLGVFLDLTADKIFVASVLIALVQIELVPAWIVVIIIAREFLVTGLRSMAAAKGRVIPAGSWGKQKTFITMVAIGLLLLAKGLGAQHPSLFSPNLIFSSQAQNVAGYMLLAADVLLLVATFWTIMSGVEYFIGALPLFQQERKADTTQ